MFKVVLTKKADNTYQRLTPKLKKGLTVVFRIFLKIQSLEANIKRLKGEPECYRYQVGGWSICYEVLEEKKEVRIYLIRPRGDAY